MEAREKRPGDCVPTNNFGMRPKLADLFADPSVAADFAVLENETQTDEPLD